MSAAVREAFVRLYEDGLIYRPVAPPSSELVERARLIEREMHGERVPEAAWRTFFDTRCGTIEWTHYERMFQARSAAAAYLAVQSASRRRVRPVSSFRCVAD